MRIELKIEKFDFIFGKSFIIKSFIIESFIIKSFIIKSFIIKSFIIESFIIKSSELRGKKWHNKIVKLQKSEKRWVWKFQIPV